MLHNYPHNGAFPLQLKALATQVRQNFEIVGIIFHSSPLFVNFEHYTDTGTNILTQRSVSSHKHAQNDVVIASQHKSISRQASTLQRWQLQHWIRLSPISLHVEKLRVGMTIQEMARDSLFCSCPV